MKVEIISGNEAGVTKDLPQIEAEVRSRPVRQAGVRGSRHDQLKEEVHRGCKVCAFDWRRISTRTPRKKPRAQANSGCTEKPKEEGLLSKIGHRIRHRRCQLTQSKCSHSAISGTCARWLTHRRGNDDKRLARLRDSVSADFLRIIDRPADFFAADYVEVARATTRRCSCSGTGRSTQSRPSPTPTATCSRTPPTGSCRDGASARDRPRAPVFRRAHPREHGRRRRHAHELLGAEEVLRRLQRRLCTAPPLWTSSQTSPPRLGRTRSHLFR
jgi:hypothetical protein